jgi:hypothetical protein
MATIGYAQLINEGFEGTFPPTGWTNSGFTQAAAPNTGIYSAGSDLTTHWLATPLLANPGTLSYYHRKVTGNTTFSVQVASNIAGPWTTLPTYPIFAGNGWTNAVSDLSAYTNVYVRWLHVQNDNTFYLDDVLISEAAIPPPTVNISTTSLTNFGLIAIGNTSAQQTYSVSASGLTADLVITAPTGYQVSTTSGGPYSSSVSITPVSGTVSTTAIYVVFAPGSAGVLSGNITNASTGATTMNVAVTGTGIDKPVITTPTSASVTSTSVIFGGNITNINFSTVIERGVYYSTVNGFADGTGTKVSEAGSYGTGIFTVSETGLTPGMTYYYKAFATNAAGTSYTVQGSFSTPMITVTGTLSNFGLVKVGNSSAEQSYSVSGIYLTNDLVITAPTGFQVSLTSGAGFGTSVSITPVSGTVSSTSVFVRFTPITTGATSGNVTNASLNTTSQTVAVSGTGINNPVIVNPTSASVTSLGATLGGNITSINFSNVVERGIYYSTTDGFADGAGTKVSELGSFGTGVFTVNVSGLVEGTVYYFKAFATNAAGTSYTAQATFSTPKITATGTLANFGSVKIGNYSTEQSYTVAGIYLPGNLIAIAPAGFQISTTSGSGFGSSVTLVPVSGTVATTTIYVRFAPSTLGANSGTISNTCTSTTSKDLAVNGTGIDNPVVINPTSASITSSTAVLGGTISNVNYSNVTERGIYYSTTSGFADGTGTKVSETGTYGTGAFTLNVLGLSQGITYYFKAFATNAAGTSYTTQATFSTPAAFSAADIVVTQSNPAVGTVVIGSIITVTVKDNQNQTPSAFQTVTCDLSQFGGPDNYPMVKTTDLPLNGIYTATYTVQPGNIEAFNSKVSVTVSNYTTVEDEAEFAVNNYLDVPDVLTSYLQVNSDPLDTTFKIGDTLHLKATFKPYVAKIWINWGHTFVGAPELEYTVTGGQVDAAYTPTAGMLTYTEDLTIRISRMQATNGFYTYSARISPFFKDVSGTMPGAPIGDPIMADLVIPSITNGLDLFYDLSKPLRFSPITAGIDGYTTLPNDFAIKFSIPEWGTPGGTSRITLRFVPEDRSTFYRTYGIEDVQTIEEEDDFGTPTRLVYQQIIWDGKDHLGNFVSPGVSTTYGITIWALEDEVGNNAVLTHDLGGEYAPHHDISSGLTILNRIHVVVDNLLPIYIQNLTITDPNDMHLVRIINDTNYNSAYDPGESVLYSDSASPTVNGNNDVAMSFRVRREYTVNSNPLRYEHVNYWVVLEQTGTASKWYFDGTDWVDITGFNHYTDALAVLFPTGATNSNLMTLNWNTSNLIKFPGSDPGITYKLNAYIQDNAGNIVKSVDKDIIIENRYVQLPVITAINLTSQHVTGPGYLPATVSGVNAYYLTSAYTAGDAPYTGNYYVTQDVISVEFTVNERDLLRPNQSVLVDFPAGFGIADFYINQADFDDVTNKYTKNINVSGISSSAGALDPGTLWTFSGNAVAAGNIQVLAYPPSTVFAGSIPAEDIEAFRLVIPPKPVFPTTNVNDYNLTANPAILSPGNPLFTYDAATNPANDNLIDETNFSFNMPVTTTNVTWTLKLETQDAVPAVFKTWTGVLTPAETPWTSPSYSFLGLKDDLTLGVPALETQKLNLKLIVQPAAYADPGYVAPPESITPVKVVTVDNTNPAFVNGTGIVVNPVNRKLTLATGKPILTETENQIIFTVYTNEPLPATISSSPGVGWQVAVKNELGDDIVNTGTGTVGAVITNITPSNGNSTDGYKTFILTVGVTNLAGNFDNLNSMLIIKAPWDKASNPGRYNSPIYPYNADVYFNDCSEAYLEFDILNAKPKITNITFTHRGVTGTAAYSSGNWNPQLTQGWVNAGSPNTFSVTATITGGMYRALYSNVKADFSAFITGATSVVPDAVTAPAGTPNEARVWTATWNNKAITAALANAWTDNQVLSIPITISTEDSPNPAVHVEQRNINIKVDKVLPVVSSTAVSITANGSAQNLVFTVTDQTPGSGVDWTTASLTLTPNTGITVGAPSVSGNNITYPVTIPAATAIKMIDASFTIMDYMDNVISPTPYHRYINVIPVPVISAVSMTTVNPGGISDSYFVPGNNIRVNFNLTNPERVKRVTVTLTASGGVSITPNTYTFNSGFAATNFYVFNGVTSAVPTDLDGKVITATVTGVTDAYIAPTASATQEINLTGNGSTSTINVDTKPVITSVKFYYNNVEVNTLLRNMTGVKIVATVTHVSNLNTTTNPMSITMSGVTGTFTLPTPTTSTTGSTNKTTTYTWDGVTFANLTWTPVSDYKIATFTFNCRTIYGYQATPRAHDMGVIGDRFFNTAYTDIYGTPNVRTPYSVIGRDPDGWFAPEHNLIVDYSFISMYDQGATIPSSMSANFDQIEDNLQDNWTTPLATSTRTPITIVLNQGGTNVNVTVYKYLAKWIVQPDVQSVWNAYEDGEAAPVFFEYRQYPSNIVTLPLSDSRSIKVDKKVPLYDTQQLWVAVKNATPASGDYQFINNGFNRPTTLALQVNGSWVTGNSIYVKYRAKDSTTGVGVTEVYDPANPTGWTITNVSQTALTGGVVEKVIKVTPANPSSISAATELAFTLGKVEDLVGHVNYGLPVNSTDPSWVVSGPVLNFNFSADYITNLELLEAFQVNGGNYTNNATKPYVKAGKPLGVILKLAPLDRGVDVQSITVSNVKINTRYITNVTGGSDNFVTMTYNAGGGFYYLNSSYLVNTAYAHGAGISLQYQINYTITYTDASTSSQTYTSQVIPNQAFVDNLKPVLKDVWVWSGSLGSAQEGYVVPNDVDGTVKVIFEEQAGFANPLTKPTVNITNLNVFAAGMPANYAVPNNVITYYPSYSLTIRGVVKNYTNVWIADLTNLSIVVPNPVVTSTEIGYTIADVVGNDAITGDRFVEIAANGPQVPIIRHAELVTSLPEGQTVTNYMAQTVQAQLKIYTDVQEIAYIEDAWATPIAGINFGAFTVATTALHNSRYVITIPVTPVNINNISPNDSIMITVNTKRNPFGAMTVFYDAETIGVRVDGEMFNLTNPAIIANSVYGNISGMINPAVPVTVTANVNDIGELIGLRGLATLPTNANLASWFMLQNNVPETFSNIPNPVVTGTGNSRVVTWTIQPVDIIQSILTETAPMSVKIQYRDIYGLVQTYNNITFNVDVVAPIISANGIKFYDIHTNPDPTIIQQSNYNPTGWVTNSLDWDKVRFEFADPIIRTDVPGSGVNSATITFTRENETYPTPALSNLQVNIVSANAIELQFINGFSANELAEGYYNFNITVVDNLENNIAYTQRFLYSFAPAEIVIQPANGFDLGVSTEMQQVSAITGDNAGQITGVHFHLYYDVNNDGIYQSDQDIDYTGDITSDDSNPDMVVPFDVRWEMFEGPQNMRRPKQQYSYLDDIVYGANATRDFLLRASVISQNRSVTDSIVVINVTDDVPPVPVTPWVTGNTTFDYLTPSNNVLTLSTQFINWIDAKRVRFAINKVGSTEVDTFGVELASHYDVASIQWNYSGKTPGDYNVVVYGRDVVGNWSEGIQIAEPFTIYDPASLVTYNMTMWNVISYGNESIIPSNTTYGSNNPVTDIVDLRLDTVFNNLNGISAITFKALVKNNITGTETIVNVPNNVTLQPDYPAIGPIPVTPQVALAPVRIFVPDSFFMPAGYDVNDFTYSFFVELTPTYPAVLMPPVYQNLHIDYFAPRVTITDWTKHVTWSKNNMFLLEDEVEEVLQNDISDIDEISMLWSLDNGATWHDAVATQVYNPSFVRFDNWNIKGGSVNTLLYNYEGNAWLKVKAFDAMGNMRESQSIVTYVDNKAPIVPITQVAYSTVDNNQIVQNPYTTLHTIGTLPNETDNTITAVASSGTYGTSILHLRTNQSNISGLSNIAIGPNYSEWYSYPNAPWYTNNNDLRPPVILYHGYSAPGDSNIVWTPGELFDHEADINGNYGFDVDFRLWSAKYHIPISGSHYFIFAAKDSRGNMEGDFADTLGVSYNGLLNDMEKKNAIDLRVNVIDVADVTGQIVSHDDNDIVSEWVNLAANVDGHAFNVNVDQVRFERKQGNTWIPISTISRSDEEELRPVMFHLYRSDVPQFDGLPFVPGVHLYANGNFVRELTWDDADGAWADTVSFVQGYYQFEYRMDLNNDGIIDGNDGNYGVNNLVLDPNGFTQFNVTPWITYFDSRNIPLGLYEFRAVPLTADGNVLFNSLAPSRWIVIDNVAPVTSMTVVGGTTRILPNENFTMVADVNELLVAQDDIVDVTYQYSSQPQMEVWLNNTSFRHWYDIGSSANMTGNYAITWAAPRTDTDLIDNDNDGLIDELDEQDATYYLRAIAKDKAGNYYTSNTYMLDVDGSAPAMFVNAINGVEMSENNNIFEIPQTGNITINAINITNESFDNPVSTRFQWMYKASQNDTWGSWQFIDGWRPVANGTASVVFPRPITGYLEGYYAFKTVSKDALGNVDASPLVTYVVFDDVNASNIHITRVGSTNIVSDAYGFAQDINAYQGMIYATIDNPLGINTATFEYALNENGPWININTIPITGQANISTLWNIPEDSRAPFIYLRATAQNNNANNQYSRTVKLYIDNVAPGIVVNSLTHTVLNNKKVIDPSNPVVINVSYTNLPDPGVVDVKYTQVRLVGPNWVYESETYVNVGQASAEFTITEQQLAALPDGIYHLEVTLIDFAGNNSTVDSVPITPPEFGALYIDRVAPTDLAIYSTTHPNNEAAYNSNITYRVNYYDLIGIPPTDAFTAVFTYQDAMDTVSEYTVNEEDGYVEFVWNPSAAFEQFLIDGLERLVVSANVTIRDFLDHEAVVPGTDNFFALTYGIPQNVRLMAVTDVVKGANVVHFVNWNMANPQVVEQLGTNHTPGANAAPLTLYAYVPHQSEIPESVTFEYRLQGTNNWQQIGSTSQNTMWNFVDPSFSNAYIRQYSMNWNIVALMGGVYEVKTTSTYLAGSSESIVLIDIYNSDLIPMPVVNDIENGNVERGNTYTIGVQEYTGTASYIDQVRYQYRYVAYDNFGVTPLSQWMYFGTQNGTEMPNWIPAPYTYDWTVYPYYLYNNNVQIVGFAKDKWGTETPISSIIQSNSFVIAHITDTIAPEVSDITVNWNGVQNPEWLSGIIEETASVKAHIVSNINPNDIAMVEFYVNGTLLQTESGYPVNNPVTDFWTQNYDFMVPVDGNDNVVIEVRTYDIYNNVNSMTKVLHIDNTAPTGDFVITQNGVAVQELEREDVYILNANAQDIPSGVKQVVYSFGRAGENQWSYLPIVNEEPFTYEWTVPQYLEFGMSYEFRIQITDNVGHVTEIISDPYEVIDSNADIMITSVAGHAPVNHVIPFRIHGNFDVLTNVPEGQTIPRLEFLIRSVSNTEWREIPSPYITALFNYSANFNLNDLPSGDYYLGVAPHGRWNAFPVDSVLVTLDNMISVINASTIPQAMVGSFNGNEFITNFTVASDDEIIQSQVELQFALPIDPNTWYSLGNSMNVTSLNGTTYQAIFNDISILHGETPLDGYYNFRVLVRDRALPESNEAVAIVANHILFDTGNPNVTLTSINNVSDMNVPINIQLGSNANIDAAAFDVVGGQIHQIASGIDRVEFYYQVGENMFLIGTDTTSPYGTTWNTLGYQLGEYVVIAKAFDKAGNSAEIQKMVSIVSPLNLQPYALITAYNFDSAMANQDHIYAVTNAWAGEPITGVAFEYYNGAAWIQFAQAQNINNNLWKANFNAELMINVQKVRAVTTYNVDMISSIKPEMNVTYSALNGGSLISNPTTQTSVFYLDKVNVFNTPVAPIVTTMYNGNFIEMPAVQVVNGDFEAQFNINNHGLWTFWSSALTYANNVYSIQLSKAEIQTFVAGNAVSTDNVVTVPVPNNSYVYFENVKHPIPLMQGYRAISAQKAAIAHYQGTGERDLITVTMMLNAAVNPQGTVVGMYYNGTEWTNCPALYNAAANNVTFNAPSGYIYAVAQYADVTINASFYATVPQYNDPANNVWTTTNTMIKFFVYDGINQGGFESPAADEITYSMYVDGMQVPVGYANGFISYSAIDLPAGSHTVRVVVNKNDFVAIAQQIINVDVTSPVIAAIPGQINSTNRFVRATITDAQTGIGNVSLYINPICGDYSALTIPIQSMTVFDNVYSYELSLDDLYNLGYDCNYTMSMVARWSAENNLEMSSVSGNINYTVNIEGPAIVFTGFENGWWLNPTHLTPMTFNVIASEGRTIPQDGVYVAVVEVTNADYSYYGDDIQYMTLAPQSVNGNVYSYSLNAGQLLSPQTRAVRLYVEAYDNYNIYNESEQTYGIDYAPPVVYAMSPVGDPIDNDGDGLFNEDPIDGINQDQDWDDYNHNGIWDGYYVGEDYYYNEPPIIDEDPADFLPAVLQYGTNVVVSVGYQDLPGFHFLAPIDEWYYTGASGIKASTVNVTLNGQPVAGITNNGSFTYDAGILAAGHYTVVASVADYAGNTGSTSYTFEIIGGAPSVTFIQPNNGWWLNSTQANTLSFTVQSMSLLAEHGVVANLYTVPANNLIQGPMTLTAEDNIFSVNILGGVIPGDQTGLRMEVITTNVWGNSSTSNQVYGLDNMAPVVTIQAPLNNAEYMLNSLVQIVALINDQTIISKSKVSETSARVKPVNNDRAGSGIANVTLNVTNAYGQIVMSQVYPANTQVVTENLTATTYGMYYVTVRAADFAGNQSIQTVNFIVPAPAPEITFMPFENSGWNYSLVNNEPFHFAINATGNVPINTVTATFYAMPEDVIIQGPQNIAVSSSGLYNVILGASIPQQATGVRLEVKVKNSLGGEIVGSQTYSIDRYAPVITFEYPANEAQIILVNEQTKINIRATYTDVVTALKGKDNRNYGSGIASALLVVTNPDGSVVLQKTTGVDVTEVEASVMNLKVGIYTIRLSVWDKTGNKAEAAVVCNVVNAPLPPVALDIADAHMYPNPSISGAGANFVVDVNGPSTISIKLYDFAGREVRELNVTTVTDAKTPVTIAWDGKNANGDKLARGTYFARVIANDGKKIVEKVVKVAIK